jgi:hypothetical protein
MMIHRNLDISGIDLSPTMIYGHNVFLTCRCGAAAEYLSSAENGYAKEC